MSGADRPLTGGSQKNMAQKQNKEPKGPPYKGGSPAKAHDGSIPNKVFALKDQGFKDACERAGVQPTSRQASKYRNGKGSAFKAKGS